MKKTRVNCPCCGYPILEERATFDIGCLCNWEDVGQDDPEADKVFGGPNGDYSHTEARSNFKKHLIMYRSYDEGPYKDEQIKYKKQLIAVFEELRNSDFDLTKVELWNKVSRLKGLLHDIACCEANDYNRKVCLDLLNTQEPEKITKSLLSLSLYDYDWKWVQDLCIKYSSFKDTQVRGIAILCFGYLARLHGQLELDKVLPILNIALHDPDGFVSGHAVSALDDINHFINNKEV